MVWYASGVLRSLDCTGANAHNSMESPQWLFRQTHRRLQLTVRQVRPFPFGTCQRNGGRAFYPRPRGICTPLASAQMDVCCLVWGLGTRAMLLSSFGLATPLITGSRRKRGFSGRQREARRFSMHQPPSCCGGGEGEREPAWTCGNAQGVPYGFFPPEKILQTRGVIGGRKTPWTGDATNLDSQP